MLTFQKITITTTKSLKQLLTGSKNISKIDLQKDDMFVWCQRGDLNSRPPAYETSALTS